MEEEDGEGRVSVQRLLEKNRKMAEELAQTKADKEFVWLLWKQLQKQSPDMTATVDMVVTREKLKSERRNREMAAKMATKERELSAVQAVVEEQQQQMADQRLKLAQVESEVTLLERKLEGQQLLTEKQTTLRKESLEECEHLRKQSRDMEEANQRLLQAENASGQEVSRLEQELRGKQELSEENRRKQEEIESLQQELTSLGGKMSALTSNLSSSVQGHEALGQQLERKQRQLIRTKEVARSREGEIKRLQGELVELRNSQDAWANHTTLQASTIQRLQAENRQLGADNAAKDERLSAMAKNLDQLTIQLLESQNENTQHQKNIQELLTQVGGVKSKDHSKEVGWEDKKEERSLERGNEVESESEQEGQGGKGGGLLGDDKELSRLRELLERTERELFETMAQLETKSEELLCLRSSHDRRLQRMQTLQTSHSLALEQLKTYEARNSPQPKITRPHPKQQQHGDKQRRGSRGASALRQEGSEAVWNELSHFRSRCQELEKQTMILEEERDGLQVRCLRNQTTIAELRACLQHEKDDLERKIDAIAELESTTITVPNSHEQKVAELELALLQHHHQQEELVEQLKTSQMECYQLRQDATHLQSSLMQVKHQQQLKKLSSLTKSTMTDQCPSSSSSDYSPLQGAYPSSVAVTDSATQVDLELLSPRLPGYQEEELRRPDLRDAQVSPLYPWSSLQKTSSSRRLFRSRRPKSEASLSYLALAGATIPGRSPSRGVHRRTYSDGDVLLHRRKAKVALSSIRDLSRSFQGQIESDSHQVAGVHNCQFPAVGDRGLKSGKTGRSAASGNVSQPPQPKGHVHDCIGASTLCGSAGQQHHRQTEGAKLKSRGKISGFRTVIGPHKCLWQQKVKTLQHRVKTLNKQVTVLTSAKQALSQSLDEERALSERAKTETKELAQRLHGSRAMIQRLSDVKQQLEEKCSLLERQGGDSANRGKAEAEWKKRLEAEQTVLSQKCAKMNETIKSLEGQLETKAAELSRNDERCSRLERDVRQKRQLIEDQRQKLKQTKEKSSKAEEKMQRLSDEVVSLQELLNQSKHKVESLRTQLNRQSSEKLKMMEVLSKCQDELAQTLLKLTVCQEDVERRKQMVASTKQVYQLKMEEQQGESTKRLTQLESVLKARGELVEELQQFAKTLASELEKQKLSRTRQASQHQSLEAVSSRARAIARSALNFSDLELDDFFSDVDLESKADAAPKKRDCFVDHVGRVVASKPPFAADLVRNFLDFVKIENR